MRKLVLLLVLLLVVAGCRGGGPTTGTTDQTFTDGAGRQVTVRGIPQRIVSMAPANTEILFALGLGPKVVGVTTWCNYPPEAEAVEKVGDAWAPNYERIVGLQPDLVLAAGTAESEIVTRLEAFGVPVFVVDAVTVTDVTEQILVVGKVVGEEARAGELATAMRRRLDEIGSRVAGAGRPSVFWALDDIPWTVGPGSFVHDLIVLAGGRNVAESLGSPYAQFSLEALLREDPDVIVVGALDPSLGSSLGDLPGWSSLRAVREGRVYRVDGDLVSRPGPRVVEGVETVARLLHPEAFR